LFFDAVVGVAVVDIVVVEDHQRVVLFFLSFVGVTRSNSLNNSLSLSADCVSLGQCDRMSW
jgi:hypothetical protein